MWNKPNNEELSALPAIYSTEHVPLKEKVVYMHFFLGGCDWYACEYSPGSRSFFGFVVLNNDYEMAEWGYFDLDELSEIKIKWVEIDRDLHWKPRKAVEVDTICKAQGWAMKGGEEYVR